VWYLTVMNITLYHYVHCPFCVRVRMALGFLNLKYTSEVLAYDDEATPVKLTGKKMLPALATPQGVINESLDIMAFLDQGNVLKIKEVTNSPEFTKFEGYLNLLGSPIHSLAMPYWMWTPEFSPESRAYFQNKKEVKRGPFKELVAQQELFFTQLDKEWPSLENELRPYYQSEVFTLYDILLASHLWGLYVVPEFQFPSKVHAYLQSVKKKCQFNYHQDFWT
jgi:glutaredoxin 2